MLRPGARMGPYEILTSLGEGGMGEVYRARDTRLERDVAVKVLPPAWAADPDRVARFEREAKAASGLSHPNVAAVYDFGEADGCAYLVMEYVAGQTLATHSGGRALPITTVVELARQMAEALDEAHTHGVVHRDIKPANVMVTPRGLVKVLDFGLARLDRPEGAPSETPTRLTRVGAVLGTVQYMSPEQVLGREVDGRSDLFSVGLVIYEMATGRPAFRADSPSQVADRILHEQPPALAAFSHDVPPELERIVRKCLEKDRECRYQSARELAVDLGNLKRDLGLATAPPTPAAASSHPSNPQIHQGEASGSQVPSPRVRPVWRHPLPVALAVTTLALAGIVAWLASHPIEKTGTSSGLSRLSVVLPPGRQVLAGRDAIAITPDGRELVCVVEEELGRPGPLDDTARLYRRSLDDMTARPIAGTNLGFAPFFSPDGEWLGFWDAEGLMKVSLRGGTPLRIPGAKLGSSSLWMPDNHIVYATDWNVFRIAADGGQPEPLLTRGQLQEGEGFVEGPYALPGTAAFLVTLVGMDPTRSSIAVWSNGALHRIVSGGVKPTYLPTGHLLYLRMPQAGGQGWDAYAVPFDLSRLATTGESRPVVEGVLYGQLAVSATGTLAYNSNGTGETMQQLTWVDRNGQVEPILEKVVDQRYLTPRVSPDGTQLVYGLGRSNADFRLHVRNIATGADHMIGALSVWWTVWTPDSSRLVYLRQNPEGTAGNLFWQAADGTGREERLTKSDRHQQPQFVTPDGNILVFQEESPATGYDLWRLSLRGDHTPKPLLQTKSNERLAALTSDGRYMAYVSDQTGRDEVWVRPFPDGEGQQLSTDGGTGPVWARDRQTLFYRDLVGTRLFAVPVAWHGAPSFGGPTVTNGWWVSDMPYGRDYDVAPDGKRLVMVASSDTSGNQITVVLNWFDDLKRKMSEGKTK